jgi:ligand-binding sensor protein
MLPSEAIIKVMDAYYNVTGLKCYFIQDEMEISTAKEKNFFCKCLKTSSSALKQCEECTIENYTNALKSNKVQKYACHAGLVKWSVPVKFRDLKGVIVSEGVITKQQSLEATEWINHLAETYNVSRPILTQNYAKVTVMTEDQVEESIKLMQDLLGYYKALIEG